MLPHRHRKTPVTYGKSSRERGDWELYNVDTLGDDEGTAATGVPAKRGPKLTTARMSGKYDAKMRTSKPLEAKAKAHDTWDVPSSDEEPLLSPIRFTSPAKVTTRPLAVQRSDVQIKLAPWELKLQRKMKIDGESSGSASIQDQREPASPDAQLKTELLQEVAHTKRTVPSVTGTRMEKKARFPKLKDATSATSASSRASSSAARLKAKRYPDVLDQGLNKDRRSQTDVRAPKRSGAHPESAETSPRKRVRSDDWNHGEDGDTLMVDDARPMSSITKTEELKSDAEVGDIDVFELQISGADEPNPGVPNANIRQPIDNERKRGRLKSRQDKPRHKIRPVPRKSATVALSDSETPGATTRSPSIPSISSSRPATPQRNVLPVREHTTPRANTRDNYKSPDSGIMTPKQAQIWDLLLPIKQDIGSPSRIAIHDLKITGSRKAFSRSTRRRTRLVDRLKASAPVSDEEVTEDTDGEPVSEIHRAENKAYGEETLNYEEPMASQPSRTHSQNDYLVQRGPKITYASSRSYVQEDSFEDGLMHELPIDGPPTSAEKSQPASQRSAFDMDESEDEGGAGRFRTLHELRAGGGNQRFMDDVGGLLDDISDHKMSARNRRRIALVDLTSRLLDAAFVEKIFRQGFEQQLLAECRFPFDEIANFALAMAFVAMLGARPPKQVIQSLRDGSLLPWLLRFLPHTIEAKELAKDRGNNMSKTMQASFLRLVETFAAQKAIWADQIPLHLTPRLVALKAIDHLFGQLRQIGDKIELIGAPEIELFLPSLTPHPPDSMISLDASLAISVLESASTSAAALTWPANTVEQLAEFAVSLGTAPERPDHPLFLALRLCMNLTNDNARNCRAFASPPTILYLLQSVHAGFDGLSARSSNSGSVVGAAAAAQRATDLDRLVLHMGILINVAEQSDAARQHAARPPLEALVAVFRQRQKHAVEAESVEESASNVAYGYLAIALANLCRNPAARAIVAAHLPGHTLAPLVDVVEEFVAYNQQVDTMNANGSDGSGTEVWTAFTERLKGILTELKAEAGMG